MNHQGFPRSQFLATRAARGFAVIPSLDFNPVLGNVRRCVGPERKGRDPHGLRSQPVTSSFRLRHNRRQVGEGLLRFSAEVEANESGGGDVDRCGIDARVRMQCFGRGFAI